MYLFDWIAEKVKDKLPKKYWIAEERELKAFQAGFSFSRRWCCLRIVNKDYHSKL